MKDYIIFLNNMIKDCEDSGELRAANIYKQCLRTYKMLLNKKKEAKANGDGKRW